MPGANAPVPGAAQHETRDQGSRRLKTRLRVRSHPVNPCSRAHVGCSPRTVPKGQHDEFQDRDEFASADRWLGRDHRVAWLYATRNPQHIRRKAPRGGGKNSPGDIPDTQAFVTYVSPTGFSLQVPEGWARTERSDGVKFADKYNAIDAAVTPASAAPTTSSVTDYEASALVKSENSVRASLLYRFARFVSRRRFPVRSGTLFCFGA